LKLPDFLIIGGTKCGTTALWYNLDKHPKISMATKNDRTLEMHFWASKTWKNGFDWYSSRFINKKGVIVGEKSTEYCSNKRSLPEVKKHKPDMKLIYCVRNPVDRAYSNFQMNYKGGKVSKFDYNVFRKLYSSAGNYYGRIKRNVIPNFSEDQLYVCVMEHMKADPTSEMTKVFDFLGVEDLALPSKILKNGRLLRNRTRQEDIKVNRTEDYYRVWSKHTEKLEGELRQRVIDYYKPLNKKLYNFLGYEIKEWDK
jgi:hypothetical protein